MSQYVGVYILGWQVSMAIVTIYLWGKCFFQGCLQATTSSLTQEADLFYAGEERLP